MPEHHSDPDDSVPARADGNFSDSSATGVIVAIHERLRSLDVMLANQITSPVPPRNDYDGEESVPPPAYYSIQEGRITMVCAYAAARKSRSMYFQVAAKLVHDSNGIGDQRYR